MSSFISGKVLCPFYKDCLRGTQSIKCEGVEPNSTIHLAFGNKVHLSLYMDKYCCKDYKSCRVAEMLFKKYEDEDKDGGLDG